MAARPGGTEITLVFVGVALGCTLVEAVVRGASLPALAAACGGATALGLLHGLAWSAAILLPARANPRWRRIGWAAIGLAIALLLPATLGAWDKLGTRSHMLAVLAIVGSIAAGALVGVVAGGFGAVDEHGEPRWISASTRARRSVAVVLVLVAIAATLVDRLAFTGLHAAAHTALRSAALAGASFAIVLLARPQIAAPWDRRCIVLALVLALVPFAVLREPDDPRLAAVWSSPFADEGIATLRRLGDVDGDGASSWLGGGDCAPWDPDVHPAAVELPDNGIDDNCRDGDASTHAFAISAIPVPQEPSPRSILLVTIETLRADRMGLYGHTRDTTPALAERARGALVFDRAYTAGAWTSIAIPTLMRGVQARRLRWQPFTETTRGRLLAPGEPLVASDDERAMQVFMLPEGGPPPLAWWLQRRGMTTAAIVDDRFSELLDPSVGTANGFDQFVDADQIRGRDPDDRVVDLAIATLRGLPADRPRFVWVHLFGPHSPNTEHEGTPRFGDGIADGYDHEIRFVDAQLDRLLDDAIREVPELVWIVTADHGEALLAADRMHGFDLSEPVVHVPLVIGGPGITAGRVAAPVSTLDLFPTILALTATPPVPWTDGVDLLAPTELDAQRVVMVDTWHRGGAGELLFDQVAATDGAHELVFEITKNAWGLVDLRDPARTPQDVLASFDPEPWRAKIRAYLEAGPLELLP